PDVPDALIGDPDRLRQIIVNLVGNAIKFTDQGEVVVRVRSEIGNSSAQAGPAEPNPKSEIAKPERSPDSDLRNVLLHFEVYDTGIGIPANKLELIFNAFEQADSSTTRRYGGTGLGLAISSRLVGLMGGHMWVESQFQCGSTFHFTARFERQQAMGPAALSLAAADLQDLPVLILDDNATNRRILEEMLRNWHLKPTGVDSAPAALEKLDQARAARQPFRLILLDAHMPGMDGFALAERIQEDPQLKQATVMMLTSGGQPGDI